MNKEHKYRLFETLEDLKIELPKIKEEWDSIKRTQNKPFSEFTDSKIQELEQLVDSGQEEYIILVKALGIVSILDNQHFVSNLKLSDLLMQANTADKVKTFFQYQEQLSDAEYWKYLTEIYSQQDYEPIPYPMLLSLFTCHREGKENLMNKEEREYLEQLPNKFDIYRAMSENELSSGRYRFSWTLNEEIAKQFQERSSMLYNEQMVIHSISIEKDEVLAYLNRREEEEIIYIQKRK